MKDYSCAQIKKGIKAALQQEPKEGSKVRYLFDLFTEFKGQILDFGEHLTDKSVYMRIKYLRDFYGMEIRHFGRGRYIFVGEYIGAKYVSYENKFPLHIKVKKDHG